MPPAQPLALAEVEERGTTWKNISHDDDVMGIVVTTKEGDRFVLTIEDAINGCKHQDRQNEFVRQFQDLFEQLNAWLNKHGDKIDRAYLSLGDEGIDFTVVQRESTLDQALDESLVDLDIAVAQSPALDLIRLDVMSLPYCAEDTSSSFVRHEQTWTKQMPR